MSSWRAALWSETLKVRRSKVSWLTAAGISLAPLVGGLFMLILNDPDWGRRAGLLTTKAQITAGTADWPTYFGLLAQATAVGGFLVFGIVATWVFGREFSDRTAKDLMALPTSRMVLVGAKFLVVAMWSIALAIVLFGLGLGVGLAIGLPGWSPTLLRESTVTIGITAALTVLVVTPVGWVASAGRGYLPPVGGMILALVLAQVLAATGWGVYFPWSIPALGSGVAGPDRQAMGALSYLLVVLVGTLGVLGTLAWWRWADHT